MTDLFALARSQSWSDRVAAATQLTALVTPQARETLIALLDDPDIAVIEAAATALLARGDVDPVLEAVWRSDDVGCSEALRTVFVQALTDGEPVQPVLAERAEAGATSAVRKGAREMLMALDFIPREYIPDDDEEAAQP